ncbi:MFS transporter [Chloroflexota bacterium]
MLALPIFSSMLGVGIISPLLPLYAENMGATGVWIGIIFASFAISRTVVMPIIGRLSDHGSRKLFLSAGLFGFAIISLGYIWADSIFQLTLVRFLHGAAAGMVLPIAQAYVGDIAPEGDEGAWMGYFNAAFFSGFGVGPLMGGILAEHFGIDVAFYSMGGFNLLAFLIVVLFLPDAKPRKATTQSHPSFREISASKMVRGIFSFRLAFSIGRGTFATFLPVFAGLYLGLSSSLIGVLLAVNILLMSLLQVHGGKLADRFNRRTLVIIGSLTNIVYLAIIPLGGDFWQLLGICALGGLAGAIAVPASTALTVGEGRRFGMGSTMAVIGVAFSIGIAIGPIISGAIADASSVALVFYFVAGIAFIGTALFAWFTR